MENRTNKRYWAGASVFICIFIVIVSILLVLILNVDGFNSRPPSSEESSPTLEPTTFAPVSLAPTRSPAPLPTPSPVEPPSPPVAPPSRSSTPEPTPAPTTECETGEEECGCVLVQSRRLDLIILVDESQSVGDDNYDLIKSAITNFSAFVQPRMDPVEGTRLGLIEFSSEANEEIQLQSSSDADTFNSTYYANASFNGGFTNQRAALVAAQQMFRRTERRNATQSIVLMITDGNPCLNQSAAVCDATEDNESCCPIGDGLGVDVLLELKQEFNISFFLQPVRPNQGGLGIDENLYDAVLDNTSNDVFFTLDEDYFILERRRFSQLADQLSPEVIELPLGPCIDEPTTSSAQRRLDVPDSSALDLEV